MIVEVPVAAFIDVLELIFRSLFRLDCSSMFISFGLQLGSIWLPPALGWLSFSGPFFGTKKVGPQVEGAASMDDGARGPSPHTPLHILASLAAFAPTTAWACRQAPASVI